ncbi:MAG: hypothetical protein QG597_1609 [Actinomycetota bacterium]|nr:hypothetical protein [Actinomycetota bacterium]
MNVRPVLADEESEWNRTMEERHPLGDPHLAGHQIRYVAEVKGRWVALASFSACAYHLADRDRWIGWTVEQAIQRRHLVVQNSRFLTLPWEGEGERAFASRVLAAVARRLSSDWQERFGHPVLLLETFVDPAFHRGVCYLAAGWTEVGATRGFRRDAREFYCADSTPKAIWVRPLRPDARDLLRAEQMPAELACSEKPLPPKQVAARLGFAGLRSLFTALQALPDRRRTNGRRYPLGCCLSGLACAVLAGCKGVRECAEFAASLSQTHLEALRAWRNPKTRRYQAPAYVTLWRTAASVDGELFEQTVNQWFRDEQRLPEAVALDGKTLRATLQNEDGGVCAVSAVSHAGSPLFSTRSSLTRKARRSPPSKS